MTKEQESKCHWIIHSAAVLAAVPGLGLAQFLVSDTLVIGPIQIVMVIGATAAGVTELIGWTAVREFEKQHAQARQ
jgi:uncharacterized protein (DUF697 family)